MPAPLLKTFMRCANDYSRVYAMRTLTKWRYFFMAACAFFMPIPGAAFRKSQPAKMHICRHKYFASSYAQYRAASIIK